MSWATTRLSVCLSVRLSVCPSVSPAPLQDRVCAVRCMACLHGFACIGQAANQVLIGVCVRMCVSDLNGQGVPMEWRLDNGTGGCHSFAPSLSICFTST